MEDSGHVACAIFRNLTKIAADRKINVSISNDGKFALDKARQHNPQYSNVRHLRSDEAKYSTGAEASADMAERNRRALSCWIFKLIWLMRRMAKSRFIMHYDNC
jgi:hypothetical protein